MKKEEYALISPISCCDLWEGVLILMHKDCDKIIKKMTTLLNNQKNDGLTPYQRLKKNREMYSLFTEFFIFKYISLRSKSFLSLARFFGADPRTVVNVFQRKYLKNKLVIDYYIEEYYKNVKKFKIK